MAFDLYYNTVLVELGPGESVEVPHGIIAQGIPIAPNRVMPDRGTDIVVDPALVNEFTVTFVNDSDEFLSAIFECEIQFSTQRDPDADTDLYWQGYQADTADMDVFIYVDPINGNDANKGTINKPLKTFREATSRVPCCWHKKMRIRILGENVVCDETASPLNISLGSPVGPASEQLVVEGQATKNLTGAAGWQPSYTVTAPAPQYTDTLSAPILAGATSIAVTSPLPARPILGQEIYTQLIQIGTEPTPYLILSNTGTTITFDTPLVNGYPAGTPFNLAFYEAFGINVAVTVTIPAAVPSFTGVNLCEMGAGGTGVRMGGDLVGCFITQFGFWSQPIVAHTSHVFGVANQVTFVVGNFLFAATPGDIVTITKPGATILFGTGTMSSGAVILSQVEWSTTDQFDCGYTDESIGDVSIIGANAWFSGGNRGFVFNNTAFQCGAFLNGIFGSGDGPAIIPADVIAGGIYCKETQMMFEKGSQALVSDFGSTRTFWGSGAIGGDANLFLFAGGTKNSNAFANKASTAQCDFMMMDEASEGGTEGIGGALDAVVRGHDLDIKNMPDAIRIDATSTATFRSTTGTGNAGYGLVHVENAQARAVCGSYGGGFPPAEMSVGGAGAGGGDVLVGVDVRTWAQLQADGGWSETVTQGADRVPTGNIIRMSATLNFF